MLNSKDNKEGKAINKIPGVGEVADIGDKLRQGKMGAAAVDLAEKGAGMAVKTLVPGIGSAALKIGKATGIPVEKIILLAVICLLLFMSLIILAGGYAMIHKWEVLKFMWFESVDSALDVVTPGK